MRFRRFTVAKTLAALIAVVGCAFAVPAVADAAFVAPPVVAEATANPFATMNVIVLGQPTTTSQVVKDRIRSVGGKGQKQFTVIPAVLAQVTGAQLLLLAQSPSIRSITPRSAASSSSRSTSASIRGSSALSARGVKAGARSLRTRV